MDKNFLNIEENERDRPIYRTMSLQRLTNILETNTLTLTCPKVWQKEDPNENYIMENEYIYGGDLVCVGYKNRFYCQSWSLEEESKLIWEQRSPEYNGAKVKTTIRKVFESLWQVRTNPYFQDRECFIGEIQYMSEEEMNEFLVSYGRNFLPAYTDPDMISQALSLLVKARTKFDYEREIRLIFYDIENKCREDFFSFPINPNSLFEAIIFDSRMNNSLYEALSKKVKEQYGFLNTVSLSDCVWP